MDGLKEALAQVEESGRQIRKLAREERETGTVALGKLEQTEPPKTVAAVDSGFAASRVHGVDLVLVRAAAVLFEYQDSRLGSVSYWPMRRPAPALEIHMGLEEGEAHVFKQLVRLQGEVQLATGAMGRWKPAVMLMDGSLLPLPGDRPSSESELASMHAKLMGQYTLLQETAKATNTQLIGVVKDTRSKRWIKRLGKSGLEKMTDTLFFHHYLREGEYTLPIAYQDAPDALSAGVQVFYMKMMEGDLPLRIEFLGTENEAGRMAQAVAAAIAGVSPRSRNGAYPAPLVEADLRSMISPAEYEQMEGALLGGSGMNRLRRDTRPFR